MAVEAPAVDYSVPEAPRVDAWRKEVANSIHSSNEEVPRSITRTAPAPSSHPRVVVNNIITTPSPPVVVTRIRPEEPTQISSRAIVGTVLGAAAGAAVAWAMTQGDEQDQQRRKSQEGHAIRMIETPASQNYLPHNRALQYSVPSRRGSVANDSRIDSCATPIENPPRTHVFAMPPHSQHSRRSHDPTDTLVLHSSRISTGGSRARPSSHILGPGTIRQANGAPPLARSTAATGTRSARNVPLPQSVATSANRQPTVSPRDSISQVSTKRSKATRRSSHHGEYEGRSRRGSKVESRKEGGSRLGGYKAMGERGSIPGF
ncbi:hypothetical protein MMC21_001834 [Puttea exsequens]|nr:hypothetical protein [Puttea exsequens]